MARWAPQRADVIAEIGTEVLEAFPRGRALVAVDGFDDALTGAFATDLASAIAAAGVPAGVIGFGAYGTEPAAPFERRYDVAAFRSRVLAPFRAGEAVPEARLQEGERGVLLVAGEYLLQSELVGIWHSTIWLDSPLERSAPDPESFAFREGKRYLRQVDPKRRTAINVDAADPAHPRRTFSDSC